MREDLPGYFTAQQIGNTLAKLSFIFKRIYSLNWRQESKTPLAGFWPVVEGVNTNTM